MRAVETIRKVLDCGLLEPTLVRVASRGAVDRQVVACETAMGCSISPELRTILFTWNGLDLDVIRLFGAPPLEEGLQSLGSVKPPAGLAGGVAIGSDPSGFVYFEATDRSVWSWDHDGGRVERLADGVDDFLGSVVFGSGAAHFLGDDWLTELRRRHLA